MRLNPSEVQGIVRSIDPFVHGAAMEVRLFGSRAKDHLKGGDIDLLIIVGDAASSKRLEQEKHRLSAAIQSSIGEQKIDLLIVQRVLLNQNAFAASVFPGSVLLREWKLK